MRGDASLDMGDDSVFYIDLTQKVAFAGDFAIKILIS
jgi:hypothetical protein